MLLPIYNSISNIDNKVLEASSDLGGSSWQTFWRVIFPLSLKGIFFGCLVVILAAFGEFAIPEFIGGGKYAFWGELVKNNFLVLSDYNTGSAIITTGIIFLLISMFIVYVSLRILLLIINKFVTIPQNIILLKLKT
jgi:spermidine/putrescine transport system permease protein